MTGRQRKAGRPPATRKRLRGASFGAPRLNLIAHKLEILKMLYDMDRNPLAAWWAFRLARVTRSELPAWVLEYFDRVARNLHALEEAAKRGQKIERGAGMVALEMKKPARSGRGNLFKNLTEHPTWAVIAADVNERLPLDHKETIAIDVVAKQRGVSFSTVQRDWAKAKKIFPELKVSKSRRLSET
jgi:hypothetical protein